MFGLNIFLRSVILGAVVFGAGSAASAMTVTRCNKLINGVFRTVIIVNHDGEKTVYPLGEDGLTRRIAYDARAAIAWASQKYGVDDVFYGDCAVDKGRDFDLVADIGGDDADGDSGDTGDSDAGSDDTGGGDTGGGDTGGSDLGGNDAGSDDTDGDETAIR